MTRYSLLSVQNAKIKVGILGGSFNPVHQGHQYISLEIIKRLGLDYIVWLVSPQNPLKSLQIQHSLPARVELANKLKKSRKIIVSDIEKYFKNNFTAISIRRIKQMHPKVQFVWIMGADNMLQVHKWNRWKYIFREVFVVVVDRANNAYRVMKSPAAVNFASHKVIACANNIIFKNNAWCFLKIKRNNISSTEIRRKFGND